MLGHIVRGHIFLGHNVDNFIVHSLRGEPPSQLVRAG
jgi:predicted nuclease with TOPRIM domain